MNTRRYFASFIKTCKNFKMQKKNKNKILRILLPRNVNFIDFWINPQFFFLYLYIFQQNKKKSHSKSWSSKQSETLIYCHVIVVPDFSFQKNNLPITSLGSFLLNLLLLMSSGLLLIYLMRWAFSSASCPHRNKKKKFFFFLLVSFFRYSLT